jgi:predicted unusual protein kinase regulating ubiquinone biosynthesis (AarF/ABC1/UbiB family)
MLFKFYLQQVFVNGFFHADPHSGNMFVEPKGDGKFSLNIVDFGMVGTITPQLKAQLRESFIGVATRDVHRLVMAMEGMGWLLPTADRAQIERAADKAFAHFWGISMGDLQNVDLKEVREFTREFRSLIYSMPFQIPSDMLFLGRALGILSGLATQIDPRFNVFEAAAPFAQKMVADETGSVIKVAVDQVVELGKAMIRMPTQLDRMLELLNHGELRINVNETDRLIVEFARMNRSLGRLQWTILFMGFLLGAIVLQASGFTELSPIVFGMALFAGAGLILKR